MSLTENIVNSEESYLAQDIKDWSDYHRHNCEGEYSYDADRLHYEYWDNEDTLIKLDKFYFVKRTTSYLGFNSWELIEDSRKSIS